MWGLLRTPNRAEALARFAYKHAWLVSEVVRALGQAGERKRARQIATTAETTARSITNPKIHRWGTTR